MNFGNALICILFTTLAASYGWGMRGSLIGGEKGAMLPGAFIGLALGWFASAGNIMTAVATGLMGMTFGGTEPYGETIGFVLNRGKEGYNPAKGYAGLALKGALWFSICGGFLGIALSYGVYSSVEIYIFCFLIPVIQLVGYRIVNCPYKPTENKYPKIYFSLTRREEWGSNLFLLIAMIIFATVKGDSFTIILVSGGFVAGAIGWLVAMRAYVAAVFPLKNGKYLFGKLYHKGVIDGWKLMEFILGAFGGFGLSTAFCVGYKYIEIYRERASFNGVKFADEHINGMASAICFICLSGIFAINLIAFICDKKGKKINSFVCDFVERPLYNVIPMMFVLAGETFSASFMAAFMLVFVVVNRLLFDRFKKVNVLTVLAAGGVCAIAYFLTVEEGCTPLDVILAGTVPYLASELILISMKSERRGKSFKDAVTKTAFATVYPSFLTMSMILIAVSLKIFGF